MMCAAPAAGNRWVFNEWLNESITSSISSSFPGGRRAVHATRHCAPSSGPARRLHPPHHFHLPELLCWHSSPGGAAQRHAGARGAAVPAIVAKEGTATWLPVLTRLPGQLPDPPLTTLHGCLPEILHMKDFHVYSTVIAIELQCLSVQVHHMHSKLCTQ